MSARYAVYHCALNMLLHVNYARNGVRRIPGSAPNTPNPVPPATWLFVIIARQPVHNAGKFCVKKRGKCVLACSSCKKKICKTHFVHCLECGKPFCVDDTFTCDICHQQFCRRHSSKKYPSRYCHTCMYMGVDSFRSFLNQEQVTINLPSQVDPNPDMHLIQVLMKVGYNKFQPIEIPRAFAGIEMGTRY